MPQTVEHACHTADRMLPTACYSVPALAAAPAAGRVSGVIHCLLPAAYYLVCPAAAAFVSGRAAIHFSTHPAPAKPPIAIRTTANTTTP